jgi:hypothetical protein
MLMIIFAVAVSVSESNAAQYNYSFHDDFSNGYANWSYTIQHQSTDAYVVSTGSGIELTHDTTSSLTASEIRFFYNLPALEFQNFEMTYRIYWVMDQPTDVQAVVAGITDTYVNIAYSGMADFHNVYMVNHPQQYLYPTWSYMTGIVLPATGSAVITIQRDEDYFLNISWTGQTANMGFITEYELSSVSNNTLLPRQIFFSLNAFQDLESTTKPGLTLSTIGIDYIDFKAYSPPVPDPVSIPEPITAGLLIIACASLTAKRLR